jgi:hypothetical protein
MKEPMDERLSEFLRQIYSAVAGLEKMFPGRRFTPDGHMVGSLGEVYAAWRYGINLYPPSHPVFDGNKDGREIQIRTTQKDSSYVKAADGGTLLVLKIDKSGAFEEFYNGDAHRAWHAVSHKKANRLGEISISLKQLRDLQEQVREEEKISEVVQGSSPPDGAHVPAPAALSASQPPA